MPIVTRRMSNRLKRKRDEMEEDYEPEAEFEYEPKAKQVRPRKKRKTNRKKTKTTDNELNKENEGTKDVDQITRLKSKHHALLKEGYKCVVGVDEAGRGPLAGPVVVSAAFVPIDIRIEGVTDSKKINDEAEREKLYEIITNTKEIKYSVAVLDHDAIDEYNILEASMMGMRQCVQLLHDQLIKDGDAHGVDYALADGNRDPRFEYPQDIKYEYIIKGDAKVYCIAAASIVAKVTRDRMMIEYDKQYPVYKLAQNKGYPTPFHKQCVWDEGPCAIHRKSFKPVKDWYKEHKPEIHDKMEALKKMRAEERKKRWAKKKADDAKKTKKGQKTITNFFSSAKKKGGKKKTKKKKKDGKKKTKKKKKGKKPKELKEVVHYQEEQKEQSVDV